MNLRDAYNLIDDIERRCDVGSIRTANLNAWPLVRLILWSRLSAPKSEHKKQPNSVNLKVLIIRFLDYLFDIVVKLVPKKIRPFAYKWASDAEVIFIGRASHSQFVAGYTIPFDRILDPIRYAVGSSIKTASVFLGTKTSNMFGRKRLALVSRGKFTPVEGLFESGLIAELEKLEIDPERFSADVLRAAHYFWLGYHSFCEISRKSKSLRAIFVSVWYSPEIMGIIAAARSMKLTVVDVQHGADETNAMANWKMLEMPPTGYQLAPNVFWRWQESQSSFPNFHKTAVCRHTVIVGGYPWISYWKFLRGQQLTIDNAKARETELRKQVLFSIRSPYGATLERIPDFILEFLRRSHPDILVVFRLHPNDLFGPKYIKNRLIGDFLTSYRVAEPSEDLYECLMQSTHLVTAFSSVCLEGLSFGVKTFLYGEDAYINYCDLIDEGLVGWTSGNADDLEQFVLSGMTTLCTQVIPSALELTSATVSELLY